MNNTACFVFRTGHREGTVRRRAGFAMPWTSEQRVGEDISNQHSFVLSFNVRDRRLTLEGFPNISGRIDDTLPISEMRIYVSSQDLHRLTVRRLHDWEEQAISSSSLQKPASVRDSLLTQCKRKRKNDAGITMPNQKSRLVFRDTR